nr:MAG TPA: repressor protein [Caudoviricetes sp.]
MFGGVHRVSDEKMYNSHDLAISIKARAAVKKISLKQMLIDCNLGSNTMSALYHGKSIAFDSLAKIADYLNCSVDYLLGRTDNPEINKSNEKTHIIKIAARNGSYKELALNDEELEELQRKIDSLPEATDL